MGRNSVIGLFFVCALISCGADMRPPPPGYVESKYGYWAPKADAVLFDDLFDLAVKIAGTRGIDTDKLKVAVKRWDFIWEPASDQGIFHSDEHDMQVYGYADCMYREVHMGRPSAYYGGVCTSAYYHELMHVYEGCADGDHVGWKENGYYEAESQWMFDCVINGWNKR